MNTNVKESTDEEDEAVTKTLWFWANLKHDDIIRGNFNEYSMCDGLPIVTTLLIVYCETQGIIFWKANYVPP